jgi:hypothetical protein
MLASGMKSSREERNNSTLFEMTLCRLKVSTAIGYSMITTGNIIIVFCTPAEEGSVPKPVQGVAVYIIIFQLKIA